MTWAIGQHQVVVGVPPEPGVKNFHIFREMQPFGEAVGKQMVAPVIVIFLRTCSSGTGLGKFGRFKMLKFRFAGGVVWVVRQGFVCSMMGVG